MGKSINIQWVKDIKSSKLSAQNQGKKQVKHICKDCLPYNIPYIIIGKTPHAPLAAMFFSQSK